ncbi:MAG: 4'-phosphopantetheinyl transferase superfamily protein, partial [Pseudomonadota bacterium]|nr:4'-phosphopantetheinyl transferase superfamily protein [Pseudomonadota bacterium]
ESFVSGDFALSGVACPPSVARSVRKRQAEFLFGRLAARLALSGQFPAAAMDEVAIGATREPVWPGDAIGSISHCGGVAAAAVQRRSPRSGIGIDIERIATGDASRALLATVVDGQEIALLRSVAGGEWSLEMLLTLVFSAKESLFKGAFGVVGRYFDFDAVQLLSFDLGRRRIRLVLTGTLCAQFAQGQHIEIGFELLDANLVLTHFVW